MRQREALARSAISTTAHLSPGIEKDGLYLGIDFGTSGARASLVDGAGEVVAEARRAYGGSPPEGGWAAAWESALWGLLAALPPGAVGRVASVAIDGTSATTMLVDASDGSRLAEPKLYNEPQDGGAVDAVKGVAPAEHTAAAPTSALCKVMALHRAGVLSEALSSGHRPRVLHQADWAASLLHGRSDTTDFNNALKLGYDPAAEEYPDWISSQAFAPLLPDRVVAPGEPVAKVTPEAARRSGLPTGCIVCGGTTDSIAAFVAAGLTEPGEAVTSLGSTMAVKMISTVRIDSAAHGIYSHRLGDTWLVGGASNTGGAVLESFFTPEQLRALSERIDPVEPSGLDYYPLLRPGERFPISDPTMEPRLAPRPEDDARFLHGMLEGIARAEAKGYELLRELGASPLKRVLTAGGGASNPKWTAIRQRMLGVDVGVSPQAEASYGAALLARQGASVARAT